MSARDTILLALTRYYENNTDPRGTAAQVLTGYDTARRDDLLSQRADVRDRMLSEALAAGRAEALAEADLRMLPPNFFEPDRSYQRRRWIFQCLAVAPSPFNGETRAIGFLYRPGEPATATGLDPDDWEHGGWVEVTEGGDQ
jgi:hypothetical protein